MSHDTTSSHTTCLRIFDTRQVDQSRPPCTSMDRSSKLDVVAAAADKCCRVQTLNVLNEAHVDGLLGPSSNFTEGFTSLGRGAAHVLQKHSKHVASVKTFGRGPAHQDVAMRNICQSQTES